MSSASDRYSGDGIRWTAARKKEVLDRVIAGELTARDVNERYGIGPEELSQMLRRYGKGGAAGKKRLRASKPDETRPVIRTPSARRLGRSRKHPPLAAEILASIRAKQKIGKQ